MVDEQVQGNMGKIKKWKEKNKQKPKGKPQNGLTETIQKFGT